MMKNKKSFLKNILDQKAFRAILPALISVIILSIPLFNFPQQNLWIRIIGYAGLYIILGLGLLVHVGLAGMFDLGFAAFYAIGAYTCAFLASPHFNLHLPFLAVILIAGSLAAIIGVLICIPVLKLRGDYLGIVTLGFGEIIRMLLMNLSDITNGSQGIIQIDKPTIFGVNFSNGTYFYYFIFALIALLLFLLNRIINSRTGRAWLAMREDEDVAQMSGIDTSKYKLLAFAIGAFIGGLGGAIFASWQGSIFPDNFNMNVSINILCVIILGGLGNQFGVILGAMALIALPDILRGFSDYRMIIFGLLLIIMMILRPQGFLPRKAPQFEGKSSSSPDHEKEVQS
ncbi:MAG: branched-chain amino acid ABC transporter permease [Anaerolineaceae bacterium]